jgi:alkylation response protein AidB-like acyl-CoA dehydrogenase
MHFAFTAEQLEIRDAVAAALRAEVTGEALRAAWQAPPGGLWSTLAELGVLGMNAPEDLGGLGLGATDWVLLHEEAGHVALPEPLLEATAAIPALVEAGEGALVSAIAGGEARVSIAAHGGYALDADRAELVLIVDGGVFAVREPALTPQPSIDGSRRLFAVQGERERLDGDADALLDRAALAASAQLLGLGGRVLELARGYACERRQFGKAIGSFQAVQHHLVDAALRLEFAGPLVHRAAWSLQEGHPDRSLHVSMAKVAASEAAALACRKSLQVHGAIGYTFEYDLHLYMKRAWALAAAWGSPAWHRDRAAAAALGA